MERSLSAVCSRVNECSILEEERRGPHFVPATGAVNRLPSVDGPGFYAGSRVEEVLYDIFVTVVRGSMKGRVLVFVSYRDDVIATQLVEFLHKL